ncbi:MAG: ABC transporter ATP-binding protein [Allobaculum sp.]
MIELKNVTKRFGDKTAVDAINLEIPSGSITGFIGPNGAGKTTTINMMTGILQPDAGQILLNGIDLEKDPLEAKKTFVSVPDSPDLFLRLTGREYAELMGKVYEVEPEVVQERINQLVEEFDMAGAFDDQMNSYSHGMRQKAIVIGALVAEPDIWFLDEPMTGLDPNASFILKERMRQQAAKGKTVFFSTHVLEVAEKLCDKIVLINKGQIVYEGDLDTLKERHEGLSLEEIFLQEIHNG